MSVGGVSGSSSSTQSSSDSDRSSSSESSDNSTSRTDNASSWTDSSSSANDSTSTESRLRDSSTTEDRLNSMQTETDRAVGDTATTPRAGEMSPTISAALEPAAAPLSITQSYTAPPANDDAVASVVAGVVGANNGMYARTDAMANTALAAHVNDVVANGQGKKAVVGAVAVDNVLLNVETGVNTKKPATNLHPVLENRLTNLDQQSRHPSRPATHAEVNALNDAIHNREAVTGKPFTEADLPSMTVASAWTKSSQAGGMTEGATAHQCANCSQITDGVNNLSGDSPRAYQMPDNTPGTGTPPSYAYQNADLSSARRGGLTGGLAAAGVSTIQSLSDGKITGDEIGQIATDTGLGAATGAAGEVIENVAGRATERALAQGSTSTLSQTTRVVGSRVAGAGVAGAVIGAGFSSVDQVRAYQNGEVTASEAIGTVTAEAATGLAAGVSGAAMGAAVGSIIPGAGTVVGGVVGFGVGMAAGYLADKGLRAAGVTDAIAGGVTSAIDAGANAVDAVGGAVSGAMSSAGEKLGSLFGW